MILIPQGKRLSKCWKPTFYDSVQLIQPNLYATIGLIFLWRAKWPNKRKSDIGYLIQAKSDAYSITDDDYASEHG
jgi:hypothetical protein